MTETERWWQRAACHGRPIQIWYPEGQPGCKGAPENRWRLPRFVCSTCPVATECLEQAMREEATHGATRFGMRGGHTPDERAALARRAA